MRAMPRLLTAAGLDLCWSRGYLVADIGRADFFAAAVASFRVLLPNSGAVSETEVTAFADELDRASADGRLHVIESNLRARGLQGRTNRAACIQRHSCAGATA
jgi:hypothetical protein